MALGQVASSTPPPIVHAIGGSVGSALALLLFYPLERARIEMQSEAATTHRPSPSSSSDDDDEEESWASAGSDRFVDASELESLSSSSSSQEQTEQQQVSTIHKHPEQQHLRTPALQPHKKAGLIQCVLNLWKRHELYRGVSPIVTTLAISNFIFFFVNAAMKQLLLLPVVGDHQHKPSLVRHRRYWSLVASCLAGIINVLMTNPLWLVSTRLAIGKKHNNNNHKKSSSLWTELVSVVQSQGWRHLWTGTGTSILLVSNPVIQFFLYEQIKEVLLLSKQQQQQRNCNDNNNMILNDPITTLGPLQAFVTGALAKAVATITTYPLQLTQSLLRLQQQQQSTTTRTTTSTYTKQSQPQSQQQQQYYTGIADCLRQLLQKDGPAGWYHGMRAKLLLNILTAAFTFLTYEEILQSVHHLHVVTTTTTSTSTATTRSGSSSSSSSGTSV